MQGADEQTLESGIVQHLGSSGTVAEGSGSSYSTTSKITVPGQVRGGGNYCARPGERGGGGGGGAVVAVIVQSARLLCQARPGERGGGGSGSSYSTTSLVVPFNLIHFTHTHTHTDKSCITD